MQNKKPLPATRSPWTFLGEGIENLVASHAGGAVTTSQILAVLTVAIEPETLQVALRDEKARPLAVAYAEAIAANPDLAATVFQFVRSKWHNQNPSHSDIVWRFIATNSFAPIVKDNGKVRLDILTEKFSDVELSRAIKKWCGTNVEPASLKEIRKRMPLPKNNLEITAELYAALNHLRTIGLCQHW